MCQTKIKPWVTVLAKWNWAASTDIHSSNKAFVMWPLHWWIRVILRQCSGSIQHARWQLGGHSIVKRVQSRASPWGGFSCVIPGKIYAGSFGKILMEYRLSVRAIDMQVGLPSDREQYIHRVGRTARAGTQGQATILLQDFEQGFLNKIKDLPVSKVQSISAQVSKLNLQNLS